MDFLVLVIAIALYALVGTLMGHVVARRAEAKGLRYRSWFWWGFWFFLPAYLVILMTPDAEERERNRAARAERISQPQLPKRKRCPDCAETIQYEARVCKHCGFRFDQTAEAPAP